MRKYTTVQGDMWDSIAKRLYGDEHALNVLLNANPEHCDVAVFGAGTVLNVPDYKPVRPDVLPPWRR